MSLRFLEEAEAEKLCSETLAGWIASAGYKGCHSAEETRKAVTDAKLWAAKSKTAHDVMDYVENADKEVLVVGMRGGYQCFDSTGTNAQNKPVVYIDLDGRLTNFVRQPHQLHFAPEDCADKGVNTVAMDNRIALLHEFGHAKQYIENPMFFDGHFIQDKGKEAKPRLLVKDKSQADPLLNPDGKVVKAKVKGTGALGKSFAQAIQARAVEVRGKEGLEMADPLKNPDGGYLLTEDELKDFKPVTGYSVRIEADNIARHEWPICDELAIPRRLNYRDIGGKSTAKESQTSTLLKRQAEAVAKKDLPKVGSLGGKTKCPKCGKMVSARGMKQECTNMLHA